MDLEPIWRGQEAAELQSEIWNYQCPQCWTACEAYHSILGNLARPNRADSRQLRALYKHAVAVLVPSVCYETFGMVILEAFRDHTAVVARATRGALPSLCHLSSGRRVVLNPDTGEIIDLGSFDTSAYREESDRLARFIDDIPTGSPVLVTSQFDVSRQLTEPAVQALRTLGLREDLRGRFNWIHAAIGAKGAPPGSVLEGIDRQVSRLTLGTPAHPRVELSWLSLH